MFKMKKLAAIAAAAVMAVSAMAVNVSAAKHENTGIASTQSNQINWVIRSDALPGVVTGLVQGRDTGVTFRCTDYSDPVNNGYYAKCTITNSRLCLYQNDSVKLSYIGDDGTVLFQNDWYRYSNGGSAPFKISPVYEVRGSGQYVQGYSR
ncbi:MAG: hypothetical protein NC485_14660 [Ruminococcus flavefaciens]|nr:hypothetical protein [Ruminococcus flavefaciens]MCM1061844.1 hypothetical protein [Eubacterium sp.]